MNILFVYYVPSGGVETLNRQRSSALKKKNINCHFLYYQKTRELVNDHEAPTFITNNDNDIKSIIDTGNYSAIIITSDYKSLPRFRQLGYQGKLILEIQGLGPQHIARSELLNAYPYVTAYANGLLSSITPHIMQILNEYYPSFPKFIFHNCFDTNRFTYRSLPPSKHPIIAWTGRIEDNKNWREFLHIGNMLLKTRNPNIKLYMFEDHTLASPTERQKFNRLTKQLNLKKNLTTFSNVPHSHMADYFSIIGDSRGFLCSTSKVEGFGYAIVEAMSCRCPVLTTDSDGVRNSIIHNNTGKYYSVGNITEAVNQAKELLTNQQLGEAIRSAALDHIKTHYSPEQYGNHFIGMLSSMGIV